MVRAPLTTVGPGQWESGTNGHVAELKAQIPTNKYLAHHH